MRQRFKDEKLFCKYIKDQKKKQETKWNQREILGDVRNHKNPQLNNQKQGTEQSVLEAHKRPACRGLFS